MSWNMVSFVKSVLFLALVFTMTLECIQTLTYPSLTDHCMLSFVKPNLLGTRKEFTNRFIAPILNGQCADSTQADVKLMKARAHVLHEMLAGCVQVGCCYPFVESVYDVAPNCLVLFLTACLVLLCN